LFNKISIELNLIDVFDVDAEDCVDQFLRLAATSPRLSFSYLSHIKFTGAIRYGK